MQIINSRAIGTAPSGDTMMAWDELEADGSIRSFEEYVDTCRLPSLDTEGYTAVMTLTMVREVFA